MGLGPGVHWRRRPAQFKVMVRVQVEGRARGSLASQAH
eukprot:CAMPEP_0181338114 /NCGR_PEP_ID=MMETSP1101-20121128/28453_1 /TAXON_ID=46948 /ORGANISM="Rhodomonas abbreviata, Strain Caron Lab Isolate" /LENGTH=37 /DNA_ID= /DNA_START= /DNA_END= /DNA_ORIENTATION=